MILISNAIENKIKDQYVALFEEQAKSKNIPEIPQYSH